jgi:hypothetical protein
VLQPDALVAWEMEATEKVPLCRLKDELFVKLAEIRPYKVRLPDEVNELMVDVKDVVLIAFGVMVDPTVTDPQLRVPLPLTVPELLVFASASIATAVVAVNVTLALTVKVPPVPVKFTFRQVASAVTVTVCPAAITTLSIAAGTTPPNHVLVLFQLPDAVEVIVIVKLGTISPVPEMI